MRALRRLGMGLGSILLVLGLVACGLHLTQGGNRAAGAPPAGALRLATLNVHYIWALRATGPWSLADWDRRKGALDAAFKAMDADIVAFQEMESFRGGSDDSDNLARKWLLERNPGYAAAAVGDWRVFPSTQPIFYRRNALRLVDQGWFFYSDTPDTIYSRTFDGSFPAFTSWAAFERVADGARITVFNVHFEYKSRSNRLKSAALNVQRMAPAIAAGGAVVLAGDINDLAGSRTADILRGAGLTFLPVRGATYHLNRGVNVLPAIDHIALVGPVRALAEPVVLRQRFGGVWPSDHYPVLADLVLER